MTNDTRAPDYPFCVGCQDNLAKCGYCQWFEGRAGVCANAAAAGKFDVGRDATPPCDEHTPRPALRARLDRRLALLAVIGLAAAMFALAYGFVKVMQGPPVRPPEAKLQLAVEADYRGATLGRAYTVTAEIYNTSGVAATDIRFEIAKESLEQFELQQVVPQPTGTTQSGEWRVLFYPQMAPLEQRRIALHLIPKAAGTFHLTLQVASTGNVEHGRADLPIRVKRPEGASLQPGVGSMAGLFCQLRRG